MVIELSVWPFTKVNLTYTESKGSQVLLVVIEPNVTWSLSRPGGTWVDTDRGASHSVHDGSMCLACGGVLKVFDRAGRTFIVAIR